MNREKCLWIKPEVDFLGITITREKIKPQIKKMQQIIAIEVPTNKRELRHFIGLIILHKHMIRQRAHIMTPLTAMTSKKVPFLWSPQCQKAFDEMKRVLANTFVI